MLCGLQHRLDQVVLSLVGMPCWSPIHRMPRIWRYAVPDLMAVATDQTYQLGRVLEGLTSWFGGNSNLNSVSNIGPRVSMVKQTTTVINAWTAHSLNILKTRRRNNHYCQPRWADWHLGAPNTSNRLGTSCETIGKKIEELQVQPGMDLAQIRGLMMAGTVPEECDLELNYLGIYEFNIS